MRQVYASRESRRKTERRATHVGVAVRLSTPPLLLLLLLSLRPLQLRSASLPCATRPNDNSRRERTREALIRHARSRFRRRWFRLELPLFCKVRVPRLQACFYITASSAFFFFYVDASCSENMEFLKGPRTPPCTCQRSAAAAAVASSSPRCG